MSYSRRYVEAIQRFLELETQLQERKEHLKQQVMATNWQDNGLNASLEHMTNGRIVTDPVARDLRVGMDRALAEATAFGMGALIRNTAFVARRADQEEVKAEWDVPKQR